MPRTPHHTCAMCRYNLVGLPLRGRCPACGSQYDLTSLAQQQIARRKQFQQIDILALGLLCLILVACALVTLLA